MVVENHKTYLLFYNMRKVFPMAMTHYSKTFDFCTFIEYKILVIPMFLLSLYYLSSSPQRLIFCILLYLGRYLFRSA